MNFKWWEIVLWCAGIVITSAIFHERDIHQELEKKGYCQYACWTMTIEAPQMKKIPVGECK